MKLFVHLKFPLKLMLTIPACIIVLILEYQKCVVFVKKKIVLQQNQDFVTALKTPEYHGSHI